MTVFKSDGFRWLALLVLIAGCDLSAAMSDEGETSDSSPSASESRTQRMPSSPRASEPKADADDAKAEADKPAATPPPAPAKEKPPAPTKEKPAAPKPEVKPEPPKLPDLRLVALDSEDSVSFRQQIVIDESCEVLDGCAKETGSRALMGVEFTMRNDGTAPLDIGSPWDADIFESSQCDQAYIPGLFTAELRDSSDRVVSRGSMATKCIKADNGSFTCGSQGLGMNEASTQPQGACNFLDVTGLEEGEYTIRVTVNPEHKISESNYDNNTVEWTVELDPVEAEDCGHLTCGASCCPVGASCNNGTCTLPDLRINYDAAENTIQFVNRSFAVDSCELEEACVGGPGTRRLLLFEGRLENYGPGNLDLGPQEGNPLFTYSECHGHYHTDNFASYALLNTDGSTAAEGHKQGYCLSDMTRVDDPDAPRGERPPPGRGTPCNRLTAGYADIYDTDTPCQWIDVTDVAPGDYILEAVINPDGHVAEVTTSNNTIRVPVRVPGND